MASETAAIARRAIETVCSGRDPGAAEALYSERFVDHVNAMTFHGLEGIRRSVGLYTRLFPDLRFEVADQVADGSAVATRWVMRGTYRGRAVAQPGITISRIEDGRIVEDWGHSDTLEIARQLGVWRTLLVVVTEWRTLLGRNP